MSARDVAEAGVGRKEGREVSDAGVDKEGSGDGIVADAGQGLEERVTQQVIAWQINQPEVIRLFRLFPKLSTLAPPPNISLKFFNIVPGVFTLFQVFRAYWG